MPRSVVRSPGWVVAYWKTLDAPVRSLSADIGLISGLQSTCDAEKNLRATSNKILWSREDN